MFLFYEYFTDYINVNKLVELISHALHMPHHPNVSNIGVNLFLKLKKTSHYHLTLFIYSIFVWLTIDVGGSNNITTDILDVFLVPNTEAIIPCGYDHIPYVDKPITNNVDLLQASFISLIFH